MVVMRQACCHPQVVRGHFNVAQKVTLTMQQLLSQMIEKTTNDCTDHLRQIIAALNGQAACHHMKQQVNLNLLEV